MNISDIRKLNITEKLKLLKDFKNRLRSLKVEHNSKKLDNPMEIKEHRKLIARVLTIINAHSE